METIQKKSENFSLSEAQLKLFKLIDPNYDVRVQVQSDLFDLFCDEPSEEEIIDQRIKAASRDQKAERDFQK